VTRRRAAAPGTRVGPARTVAEVEVVRSLFREYAAGLGVDLGFEGFPAEVDALPGRYAPPAGTLLLARQGAGPVGCAGVRPLDPGGCELKRLYVRRAARGRGVGRQLVEAALAFARGAGYERMSLDTLPSMGEAIALYASLGFVEVPPYNENPVPGTRYFRRAVDEQGPRGTSK
jgi:putative acetyltransferase